MNLQKLTLHHYALDKSEERRITLSPSQISAVAAEIEDVTVNGRSLRNVTVLFLDGGNIGLTLNHADLETLEAAIGTYCLSMD